MTFKKNIKKGKKKKPHPLPRYNSNYNVFCIQALVPLKTMFFGALFQPSTSYVKNKKYRELIIPLFHRDFGSSFTRRKQRFISSGHLRKTIVSQSDESDLCLLTIRSVSDVFGVICVCRQSGQCLA